MKNKNLIIIILIIIVLLASGGFYLYKKSQGNKAENETEELATTEPTEILSQEEKEETTKKEPEKRVLMFGRSVMAGWFNYWGSEELSAVKKEGFTLEYKNVYEPPEIVEGFKEYINDISKNENPIIFFKFCFVDFEGSSKSNAQKNLQRNEKYIEEIYETTKSKGLKLIIGNALPQVPSSTDNYLKWNHDQYNKRLIEFQKKYPQDVFIFDMYNVLSDSSGYLRARYTNDLYDSHPNEKAYSVLDLEFFKLLKKNF